MSEFNIPYGFKPLNPEQLDKRFGPYQTMTQAMAATSGIRVPGLRVGIISSGVLKVYEVQNDINVLKETGVTDSDRAILNQVSNKVDKESGKSLIDNALIQKVEDLPSNEDLILDLDSKVDKELNKSLVQDDLVLKLEELPDIVELQQDFDTKVDKESGKSLIQDTLISKLEGLPTDSELAIDLDSKVDKEVDKSLVQDTLITKLEQDYTKAEIDLLAEDIREEIVEGREASLIRFDNSSYPDVESALNALLYEDLVISTFSGGSNNEIGSSVSPVLLTWSYNKDVVSQSINQGVGNLSPGLRSHGISAPVTSNTTYTLTANDGVNTKTRNVSVNFYKRIFYGSVNSIPSTSSQVRLLASNLIINNTSSYDLSTGTTLTKFIIAIPSERNLVSVIDRNNANTNIVSAFNLINPTFNVQDAGGNNQTYKLYALEASIPYSQNNTLNININ